MTVTQVAFLLLLEAVSLVCVVALWVRRRGDGLPRKILWTVLLLVPVLGPLMWGAFYGGLPSRNRPRPDGSASGWTPHRRDL